MKRIVFSLFIGLLCAACNQEKELTANEIIDKSIKASGGDRYQKAEIIFDFRDISYKSSRQGGKFSLERQLTDSTGTAFHDLLNNEGFTRYHKDSVVALSDSLKTLYGNSVNSVHYFVQLPFGLNDEAVNKELIGKDSIEGREYYEIKVTFNAESGGEDHEDVYMYWINTRDFFIDYLAYSFEVNDGGIRFRRAINPRFIEGIRFVDYENYKTDDLSTPLEKLDELFEQKELELLSNIENKRIRVKILD